MKMEISRRSALGTIAVAVGGSVAALAIPAPAARAATGEKSKLFLLGTGGGPILGGERRMSSNVITVGDKAYVIDCGYGAAQAIAEATVPFKQIASIFITHNHADHMLDYGSLLFFCWLQGRVAPIDVYGPPPLKKMTQSLLDANTTPLDYYKDDLAMNGMPEVNVHELSTGGYVMDDGIAKVTCAVVEHPPVLPSFGYRFDLADRSIVFSGDTTPSDALIKLAKGADMLVHEAAIFPLVLDMMKAAAAAKSAPKADGSVPQSFDEERFKAHMYNAHTSAEDAGRVAAAAGVGTLVLNHLTPGAKMAPDSMWTEQAAKHFKGKIVVAHDGMVL